MFSFGLYYVFAICDDILLNLKKEGISIVTIDHSITRSMWYSSIPLRLRFLSVDFFGFQVLMLKISWVACKSFAGINLFRLILMKKWDNTWSKMETSTTEQILNPKEKSNPISSLFFLWTFPLFRKGYKKELTIEDIYTTLQQDKSDRLGDILERYRHLRIQLTFHRIMILIFFV